LSWMSWNVKSPCLAFLFKRKNKSHYYFSSWHVIKAKITISCTNKSPIC
jgi:hypothetical protein